MLGNSAAWAGRRQQLALVGSSALPWPSKVTQSSGQSPGRSGRSGGIPRALGEQSWERFPLEILHQEKCDTFFSQGPERPLSFQICVPVLSHSPAPPGVSSAPLLQQEEQPGASSVLLINPSPPPPLHSLIYQGKQHLEGLKKDLQGSGRERCEKHGENKGELKARGVSQTQNKVGCAWMWRWQH